MRTDQQLSVVIGGDPLQVICEDSSVIDEIRPWVQPFLADATVSLLGFRIEVPSPSERMWVLLGGNGVVLARSKQPGPLVRSLLRHLSALLHGAEGAHRLRLGMIEGPGGVLLIDHFLQAAQPVVERQYDRKGLRVLDSPFVDIADAATIASGRVPNALTPDESDIGHVSFEALDGRIRGLMWRSNPDTAQPTLGQTVHALATTVIGGSEQERLDRAAAVADGFDVVLVDGKDPGSVLRYATSRLAQ